MTKSHGAISRAIRRSAKTRIPEHFRVARYANAAKQDACWWCLQIGNRLFLQAVLRAGHLEQFRELSERLRADPFSDLGFRYRNMSCLPAGSHKLATVTSLTFERATLISELQERIGSKGKDYCDDALAESTTGTENLDLLGFASIAHICIDLTATNKKILSDFRLYLTRHRRKATCPKPVRSVLSSATFSRWFICKVLPCFDIKLWAESEGLSLGPTELGEWLGVGSGSRSHDLIGINAKDFYSKKVLPAYKQAFNTLTFQTLYTLSHST